MLKAYTRAGYTHADSSDKLFKDRHALKLLGLFSDSHIPYAIDRKHSKRYEHVPNLEAMFRVALSNLSQRKAGFCLQVEAGRVDHAGHAQDMAALIEKMELAKSKTGQGKPILNLMTTEMGFGVDFMVGTHKWHGVAPNDEQLANALNQLEETLGDY